MQFEWFTLVLNEELMSTLSVSLFLWLSFPVLKRRRHFDLFSLSFPLAGRVWQPNQTIDINHNFRYFLLALITFIHFSLSLLSSPFSLLSVFLLRFFFLFLAYFFPFFSQWLCFFFFNKFCHFLSLCVCVLLGNFPLNFHAATDALRASSRRVVALMSLILVNTLRG